MPHLHQQLQCAHHRLSHGKWTTGWGCGRSHCPVTFRSRMAGLSAVPLGSKDRYVYCFRRKRTLGGRGGFLPQEPTVSGNQEGILPVAQAVFHPHFQEPGESSHQTPCGAGRGQNSTRNPIPTNSAVAGGSQRNWRPPGTCLGRKPASINPPGCTGSPPTPSAVSPDVRTHGEG